MLAYAIATLVVSHKAISSRKSPLEIRLQYRSTEIFLPTRMLDILADAKQEVLKHELITH